MGRVIFLLLVGLKSYASVIDLKQEALNALQHCDPKILIPDNQASIPKGIQEDLKVQTKAQVEEFKSSEAWIEASEKLHPDNLSDQTIPEKSDDLNEGISRLGAVIGSAEETSFKGSAQELFQGSPKTCSEMPFGLRDCCKGDGFLEGVFHCPAELKALQRAKLEKRAFLIGHYKKHLKTIYVYCIFPTKLAGILQIQGRWGQLGIGFGGPKFPVCDRGFQASLLERIDFNALDLSAIANDFKEKADLNALDTLAKDYANS